MTPLQISTGRGPYRLTLAEPPAAITGGGLALTLRFDRADGLERVGFRCVIAPGLVPADALADPAALLARLAPWFEREFEITREAALKSIRTERRLAEVVFDRDRPGPLGAAA